MPTEIIKQLLEAGVHFGHQTKRWNPKMKRFIFGRKSGIYVIDLEKSALCLQEAQVFLKDIINKEKSVLFVGTKKQAQEVIKREAERCGMFYITQRWIGGLLTNFPNIKNRIARFKEIEKMEQDNTLQAFTKKEVSQILKEKARLEQSFGGVKDMSELPGALFIIDAKKEENAIREARKLKIPVVALIDTNSDPDIIDYPIPGNDDAIKAIEVITTMIATSILEVRQSKAKVENMDLQQPTEKETEIQEKAALTLADEPATDLEEEVEAEGETKPHKKTKIKKVNTRKQKEGA